MSQPSFHIAFCADEAFAQHTAVALRSVIATTHDVRRLRLWVLDAGLAEVSRRRLAAMVQDMGGAIAFRRIPFDNDRRLFPTRHISRAMYGRLFLPELMDSSISTCLYLDSDIVVSDDILQLAAFPLEKQLVAGVPDFYQARSPVQGLPPGAPYYNSGVLLMNLARWRQEQTAQKVLQYVHQHFQNLLYPDQDALNATLCGRWASLPLRWNQQRYCDDHLNCLPDGSNAAQMAEAMRNPAVIHFIGSLKPWRYLCEHPDAPLYFRYLAQTPWASFRLPSPKLLPQIMHGRRIVFFGAGYDARKALHLYHKLGCQPLYFVDNDPVKTGQSIEGLTVFPPERLIDEKYETLMVIITSMFEDVIAAQLQGMGLTLYRQFAVRGCEDRIIPLQCVMQPSTV